MESNLASAPRILIVDDEPTLVFFLRRGLLEASLNCDVESVGSGEEALARLTFDKYSVLVTDLKMPGINGLTLAAAARSLQPAIGVILMTAYGSREIEAEAEQLMVDAYLTKPFQLERLRDLIEKILHAQLYSDTNNIIGAEHAGTQPQNRSAMEVE